MTEAELKRISFGFNNVKHTRRHPVIVCVQYTRL